MKKTLFTILVIVLLLTVYVMADDSTACQTKNKEGEDIDLSKLSEADVELKQDTFTYYIGVCKNSEFKCKDVEGKPKVPDSIVTQLDSRDTNGGLCYPCANTYNAATNNVQLDQTTDQAYIDTTGQLYDGAMRKSRLDFVCDEKAEEPTGTVSEKQNPGSGSDFTITIKSKYACPGFSEPFNFFNSILGVGGILIIIIIVAIPIFFVVGILIMKFALKKEGLEIIPLWFILKDLPFLFKDGVALVFVDLFYKGIILRIKNKGGSPSAAGYEEA
mmetsp:Transcript_6243/g.9071  ORF Transcript_6243/g.9071 Transcript_6243/m.9071 type:complete len:273 (+) Transcript_6243:35-853(+)